MPTAVDTTALLEALTGLAGQVATATPSASVPGDLGPARRRRLAWHLDDYLLRQVQDLEAPLVILLGSTGAGKSSLLNGLAGAAVSPSGVVRPTTMRPVVLLAPGQVDAFMGGKVLAALADADRLQLVVHDYAFPEIALVDAPDVDSVENPEPPHRRRAAPGGRPVRVRHHRPALRRLRAHRGSAPGQGRGAAAGGGQPLPRRPGRPAGGAGRRPPALRGGRPGARPARAATTCPCSGWSRGPATRPPTAWAAAIEPVRQALADLSADTAALTSVKAQALRGALAGLPAAVAEVAADLEADRRRAAALQARWAGVRGRGGAAPGTAGRRGVPPGRGDALLAGVRRGQRHRPLAVDRGRAGPGLDLPPPPAGPGRPELQRTKEQAFEELVGALVRHADAAAGNAATAWAADPAGRCCWRPTRGCGARSGAGGRRQAQLAEWLTRLTKMVEERGHSRRAFAFAASLGVNAIGVVAMLAVFAHSAGLTGGEVAIAGGTAVINQKLLEALIGEAAVADIIRAAERATSAAP